MKYELAPVKVEIAENGIIIEVADMSHGEGYRHHVFTDINLADAFLEQYFNSQRKELKRCAGARLGQRELEIMDRSRKDPTRRFDIE